MKAKKPQKVKPEKKPTWKSTVERRLTALEDKAGIVGPRGPQGEPGETGATGETGETGAKGEKGSGIFG